MIDKAFVQNSFIDVICLDNCATCSGTLAGCMSCSFDQELETSFYLEDGACVQECKAGFYEGKGYLCQPCEAPCLECDVGPQLCTLCDPNHSAPLADPVTLQCFAECPEGTYEDTEKRQCLACESPCYTCSSADACLQCDYTDPNNLKRIFFPDES